MDRTYLDDTEVGVGTKNDAVLVCAADGTDRARLASVLRQDYPVRTADSESDAVASIDQNVTVLVVDDDDEFSLDQFVGTGGERDYRFQMAAIVSESPAQRLRELCDGFVHKPVDEQELRTTVRWLHRRGRYDRMLGAYYALSEKYATLVTGPDTDETRLRSVEDELAQLREELDDIGDALEDEDAFQVALTRGSNRSP